jgi:hypothetical protein
MSYVPACDENSKVNEPFVERIYDYLEFCHDVEATPDVAGVAKYLNWTVPDVEKFLDEVCDGQLYLNYEEEDGTVVCIDSTAFTEENKKVDADTAAIVEYWRENPAAVNSVQLTAEGLGWDRDRVDCVIRLAECDIRDKPAA